MHNTTLAAEQKKLQAGSPKKVVIVGFSNKRSKLLANQKFLVTCLLFQTAQRLLRQPKILIRSPSYDPFLYYIIVTSMLPLNLGHFRDSFTRQIKTLAAADTSYCSVVPLSLKTCDFQLVQDTEAKITDVLVQHLNFSQQQKEFSSSETVSIKKYQGVKKTTEKHVSVEQQWNTLIST